MRVRVTQPSDYCVGEENWRGTTREGWIRWRDEQGPWVWFYSRAC